MYDIGDFILSLTFFNSYFILVTVLLAWHCFTVQQRHTNSHDKDKSIPTIVSISINQHHRYSSYYQYCMWYESSCVNAALYFSNESFAIGNWSSTKYLSSETHKLSDMLTYKNQGLFQVSQFNICTLCFPNWWKHHMLNAHFSLKFICLSLHPLIIRSFGKKQKFKRPYLTVS